MRGGHEIRRHEIVTGSELFDMCLSDALGSVTIELLWKYIELFHVGFFLQ